MLMQHIRSEEDWKAVVSIEYCGKQMSSQEGAECDGLIRNLNESVVGIFPEETVREE
jgi:hypothetical protein